MFRASPERSDILGIIKQKVWTEECKTLWHEGDYIFDIINYSTWQEAVVSRYGDGAFYKKHHDTRRDHITYRLVTLVYYVNRLPEQFTGGSLILCMVTIEFTLSPNIIAVSSSRPSRFTKSSLSA